MAKTPFFIRLTEEAATVLTSEANRLGLNPSGVLEVALRERQCNVNRNAEFARSLVALDASRPGGPLHHIGDGPRGASGESGASSPQSVR
jgi:hypothetical protein